MLKRILAGVALALLIASPVAAVPKVASGTIAIASLDARIGGAATFTVTTSNLKGSQYPMVYLACVAADGQVVYGQLDHPDTVFILGGGSSPWIDPVNVDYLALAICTGYLYAYTPFVGNQTITLLATSESFAVSG